MTMETLKNLIDTFIAHVMELFEKRTMESAMMKLHGFRCISLFLCLLQTGFGLSFDVEDFLSLQNNSCSLLEVSCNAFKHSRMLRENTHCYCDDQCLSYSDCCLDASKIDFNQMKQAVKDFECIRLHSYGSFYMKGQCNPGWENTSVQKLCLQASPGPESSKDPLMDMPATSTSTGVTYKNLFCGLCNGEEYIHMEMWRAQLSCPNTYDIDNNDVTESLKKEVKFVNDSWGILDFRPCFIHPSAPDHILTRLRRCVDSISTCASDWHDREVDHLCQSYNTIVYSYGKAYRNYHCAKCNHHDSFDCVRRDMRFNLDGGFDPKSFSILFDFGSTNSKCDRGEIYDPFFKKCRLLICSKEGHEYIDGRCIKTSPDVEIVTNITTLQNETEIGEYNAIDSNTTAETIQCEKILLDKDEISRKPDGTVYVLTYWKEYSVNDYTNATTGIWVCAFETGNYSQLMGWLTLTGLGISCICICVHLVVFFVIPERKNLSEKNLASMCLALLVAYICFLVSVFLPSEVDCTIIAAIMYYSFMASFTWMNVTAFDVWRTLKEMRVTSGAQVKRFIGYSLYAWMIPGVALFLVLIIDYTKPDIFPYEYVPGLGERLCWFGQPKALLLFFVVPLATIMVTNGVFFILSVAMVKESAKSTSMIATCQRQQVQPKLFYRLALLMGLSWTSGIVAGYLQLEPFWYVFLLLNAFQGLYIAITFTWSKKVRKSLKAQPIITQFTKGKRNLAHNVSSLSQQRLECSTSNDSSQCSVNTSKSSIKSV